MPIKSILIAAALAAFALPAHASTVDGAPEAGVVHRLSPDETRAVQDAAARRKPVETSIDGDINPSRAVHGEVGFAVGTGGYNAVFGTAVIPLGESGVAAVSFERSDYGRRRYRR